MSEPMNPTLRVLAILTLLGATGCSRNEPTTLVIAFQPQEDTAKLAPNAAALAHFIGEKIGLPTKVFLPADYIAVVEALRGKQADVAYFSAWPYALATELAGAEIFAAERRNGETHYWSHWYVRADSPYKSLADLKGKPIAFTSPTSTSGWLFPMAKLTEEGVVAKGADPKSAFSDVLFAGGYEQALKALVAGQVEAAAASDYAPARFLSVEQRAGVRVLAKQGPVPTHVLAWRKDLPPATKEKIRAAFLALNEPANKVLLANTYGSEALVAVDESHVLALQKALDATGRGTELSTFKK